VAQEPQGGQGGSSFAFTQFLHSFSCTDTSSSFSQELEKAKIDLEIAQRENNFEAASRLRYDIIPSLQSRIPRDDGGGATGTGGGATSSAMRDRVTSEDIARVVARSTGIPVQNLLKGEKEKLIHVSD